MIAECHHHHVPLRRRAVFLLACVASYACTRHEHGRGPGAGAAPAVSAPASEATAASGTASAASAAGASAGAAAAAGTPKVIVPSGSYLAFDREGRVVQSQPDGTSRVLSRVAASQTLDDAHGLLWSVSEGSLMVSDLRGRESHIAIADGLPPSPAIWVRWPAQPAAEYVRPLSACEPEDVVEVVSGAEPRLRQVGQARELPLRAEGRRWLAAQARRHAEPGASQPGFAAGAPKAPLPAGWAGCEEADRCGLSASFGPSGYRLVLVQDRTGSDCRHRACLLFDPAAGAFASPPVVEDAETGALSLAHMPLAWSSVEAATPGVCGPYLLDAAGRQMLVRRFLCELGGACRELEGEALGWSKPGPIVGEPG